MSINQAVLETVYLNGELEVDFINFSEFTESSLEIIIKHERKSCEIGRKVKKMVQELRKESKMYMFLYCGRLVVVETRD